MYFALIELWYARFEVSVFKTRCAIKYCIRKIYVSREIGIIEYGDSVETRGVKRMRWIGTVSREIQRCR